MQVSKALRQQRSGAVRRRVVHRRAWSRHCIHGAALAAILALAACATKPLIPYSTETPPLALVEASQAGVQDKRARFREIYLSLIHI